MLERECESPPYPVVCLMVAAPGSGSNPYCDLSIHSLPPLVKCVLACSLALNQSLSVFIEVDSMLSPKSEAIHRV